MVEELQKDQEIIDYNILLDHAQQYDKDAFSLMVEIGGTEPSTQPLQYFLEQLLKLYLDDKMREAIGQAIEKANTNPGGVVPLMPDLISVLSELYEPITPASQNKWKFESLKNALEDVSGIEWVIEGWLAFAHITLLVGVPKIGKSSILLNMALNITNGDTFLGKDVKKSRVAIASGCIPSALSGQISG